MKNLYLIVGPSGSGKSTLARNLAAYFDIKEVQSYTTRPQRYRRETGHIFVTDEQFDELGKMVGYVEYAGYRYGVTECILDKADIYVIDPEGAAYLSNNYKRESGRICVIWLVADGTVCTNRMRLEGRDEEEIEARIDNDRSAFSSFAYQSLLLTYGFCNVTCLDASKSKDDMLMAAVDFIMTQER